MTGPRHVDGRDARTPLEVPPLGPPAEARQCEACHQWFPWKAFYRGKRKDPHRCCDACREAGLRAPARELVPGKVSTRSYRRQSHFDRRRGRPRPE